MAREISARAARFWKRLAAWYGARLADQYGVNPPADWCVAIDAATDDAVIGALSTIKSEHLQFPPTLPQVEAALRKYTPTTGSTTADVRAPLINAVLRNYRLSDWQMATPWRWQPRWIQGVDHAKQTRERHGCEIVGVIVPQDPQKPDQFPEIRVTVDDLAFAARAH